MGARQALLHRVQARLDVADAWMGARVREWGCKSTVGAGSWVVMVWLMQGWSVESWDPSADMLHAGAQQ